MTMTEVLDAVVPLSREQRILWLIDLGWAMTVLPEEAIRWRGRPSQSRT
jgi:hypothetical protein